MIKFQVEIRNHLQVVHISFLEKCPKIFPCRDLSSDEIDAAWGSPGGWNLGCVILHGSAGAGAHGGSSAPTLSSREYSEETNTGFLFCFSLNMNQLRLLSPRFHHYSWSCCFSTAVPRIGCWVGKGTEQESQQS